MAKAISTLLPWYGSNRMNAHRPGELLKGCKYALVGSAGGMSEVPYLDARTIVVNDLHCDLINCAAAFGHERIGPILLRRLKRKIFHPEELRNAQLYLHNHKCERGLDKAEAYYVACWMTRSEASGTGNEYDGNLCLRYDAGGGDSALRYRNSLKSAQTFRRTLRRCSFCCKDIFALLTEKPSALKDDPENGGYFDLPWPDDGDKYEHPFDEFKQRRFASIISTYQQARIVIRFGDHPLIRELYPEPEWTWIMGESRTQANKKKSEVLITKGCR